ncbi:MAG: hypothetical protein QMB65_02260, partial [Vicingaceae bacterium]
RCDNTGVELTYINADDSHNFSKIEILIGSEVNKIPLPEGFSEGPKYDTNYKKPFKGGGKKNFSKKKNWKPRKKA